MYSEHHRICFHKWTEPEHGDLHGSWSECIKCGAVDYQADAEPLTDQAIEDYIAALTR